MVDALSPILTALKNGGPPLYAATLVATLLAFVLPETYLLHIGLLELREEYKPWLGAALILSLSFLAVHIAIGIGRALKPHFRLWRHSRIGKKVFSALTNEEKEFLRPYIREGLNTRHAPISNGVVNGLEAKEIIYRASNLSTPGGMNFPWNLQPYARKLLVKRPAYLD